VIRIINGSRDLTHHDVGIALVKGFRGAR